jgi:hypothetical protein
MEEQQLGTGTSGDLDRRSQSNAGPGRAVMWDEKMLQMPWGCTTLGRY